MGGDASAGSKSSKGEKRKSEAGGKKDEPKEKKKKDKEDNKPRGFARGLNAERIIGTLRSSLDTVKSSIRV